MKNKDRTSLGTRVPWEMMTAVKSVLVAVTTCHGNASSSWRLTGVAGRTKVGDAGISLVLQPDNVKNRQNKIIPHILRIGFLYLQ